MIEFLFAALLLKTSSNESMLPIAFARYLLSNNLSLGAPIEGITYNKSYDDLIKTAPQSTAQRLTNAAKLRRFTKQTLHDSRFPASCCTCLQTKTSQSKAEQKAQRHLTRNPQHLSCPAI